MGDKATPETGTTNAGEQPAQTDADPKSSETGDKFDAERAVKTIKNLADAVEDLKKQVKQQSKGQPAQQGGDLASQITDLTKQITDLKNEAAIAKRMSQVIARASAKDWNDPYDAWLLIKDSLDESGDLDGVDEALDALALAKPYLTKTPDGKPNPSAQPAGEKPADKGKKPSPGNPGKTGKLSRADLERMSAEEINRRWEEVQATLTSTA